MAGYSGTPTAKKLGIESGQRLLLRRAPDGLLQELELPEGVEVATSLRGKRSFDVALLLCSDKSQLFESFAGVQQRMVVGGGLWVAWPKKSSGVATDLSDAIVRNYGLSTGWVDNKVCAINEVWSGLRFVQRVADRSEKGSR